jgi:DNA-binding transcriptional regulator YdaS (Cro superfamily)
LTKSFSFAKLVAMNLAKYLEKKRISNIAFADSVGVSTGMVSQWLSGHRPVSTDKCVLIEKITEYEVKRQDLRPDDYWLHWPDLKAPKKAA